MFMKAKKQSISLASRRFDRSLPKTLRCLGVLVRVVVHCADSKVPPE